MRTILLIVISLFFPSLAQVCDPSLALQMQKLFAGKTQIANLRQQGMYLYSLVCDGRFVDTKQMLLTE
jgi:hypothetical protein